MGYDTSYKTMVGEERVLWEDLITGSCKLMHLLYGMDEGSPLLSGYINVLFGLRSAKVDYNYLMGVWSDIYRPDSHHCVDKFRLQKAIKDYLGNIDSSLDYLQNLLGAVKIANEKSRLHFERGNLEFDRRINDMRNEVMHEGVPSLSFDPGRRLMDTCHSDVAGGVEMPPTIRVKFARSGKWQELGPMVENTYCNTRTLISSLTKELCAVF